MYDEPEKPKFIEYFFYYLYFDNSVYETLCNIIAYEYFEVPDRCNQGVWKGSLDNTYIPPH